MKNLKDSKLALLFTRGISLSYWEKIGSLDREIKPYIELSESFGEIFFFTYGDSRDLRFKQILPKNIMIIPKPVMVPNILYVFLMPLIHAALFRKIDIIKTNQMDGSWAGVLAKNFFHKKLVVRVGYEWLNFLKTTNAKPWKKLIASLVESVTYNNANKIIITSDEDKKFIEREFGITETTINVIRNYIDTNLFREDQSVLKDPKRIVFVGRLEKDKNLLMLVEALAHLDCKLVLIGEGSQKSEIKKLAEDLRVNVEFLGKVSQSDLPKEFQKSALFVLPSFSEGNPKALLEAMSCSLPVVGTSVKGIREVIEDGKDGLLAMLSPVSIREKIQLILENGELRDRLGANAREKILKEYALESILEKELSVYKNL